MKKIRVVILNKSRKPLFVEYKQCGQAGFQKLLIKKRTVLKLPDGRHEFCFGYENANLEISNVNGGIKDIEEIPSMADDKCKGVKLLVHDSAKTLKIKCKSKISVAGLIEKLS